MSNISKDVRRATQDIDMDFIKYSLNDRMIRQFIDKVNCLEDINITIIKSIEELKQQDYQGKRVYVRISDNNEIVSKIDFGVHKDYVIEQDEYCFDVCLDDEGASLLMNSKEQIFTEKLRSLLKLGTFSARDKDIFDMYFLCDKLDFEKLNKCLEVYVYEDSTMRENNVYDVIRRMNRILSNKSYCKRLNSSRRKWIDIDIYEIKTSLLKCIEELSIAVSI